MSMKHAEIPVTIQGEPEFSFKIPAEHVDVLFKFAERHYDYRCKASTYAANSERGTINGFLRRWKMAHQFKAESKKLNEGVEEPVLRATWDELDTLLKITEVMHNPGDTEDENNIAWKYHFAFKRALIHASELRKTWKTVFDAGPNAS